MNEIANPNVAANVSPLASAFLTSESHLASSHARRLLRRALPTLMAGLAATSTLVAADVSPLTSVAAPPAPATPTISPLGPPLPGTVVDLFLPPTRASEPYAATAAGVFRYSAAERIWQPLYQPALKDSRVAGLAGYARSSKVLYVAHSLGVARTRDGGATWEEMLPIGLGPDNGAFLGLSVNPTNRYAAVLAHEHAVWRVNGQAGMFEPLDLADQVGAVQAAIFSGVAPSRLVVAGEKGIFLELDRGVWQRLKLPLPIPSAVAVSPNTPLWLVTGATNSWVGDFSRPGYGQTVTVTVPAPFGRFALDGAARGVVWWAEGGRLLQADLKHPATPPTVVHESARPIALLRAHPREADTVLWAAGNQVLRAANTFAGAGAAIQQPLNINAFQPAPTEPVRFGSPTTKAPGKASMAQMLDQVLAEEPSLKTVAQAALERARFDPDRVLAWQRDARRRNWLPQLRVGGGFREYSLDQNIIVDGVDRFGVPTHNDLRLSDATRPFGYVGVTLVWDLDKLRYDPEQVDITKEGRYQAKYRSDLLTQVSRLYYLRIDTLVKLRYHGDSLSDADAVAMRLKLRETTDLLNALCDRDLLSATVLVAEKSPAPVPATGSPAAGNVH